MSLILVKPVRMQTPLTQRHSRRRMTRSKKENPSRVSAGVREPDGS